MKKIKLITSLNTVGILSCITPIIATSCSNNDSSSSTQVKVTKYDWRINGGVEKATTLEKDKTYYLGPETKFDNNYFEKYYQ